MNDAQFSWTWWLQFFGLIATKFAVLVALFGDPLRRWLFPPKLILKLNNKLGTWTPVTLTSPDGAVNNTTGLWYHVSVANSRRWTPATQCQVFLLRVESKDASGKFQTSWVGEIPLNWRFGAALGKTSVTVGSAAEADLCNIVRAPEPGVGKRVQLGVLIAPKELETRKREKFDIIVTLQAKSVEADSNVLRIQIAWNGDWSEDQGEMSRYLVVREYQE